MRVRRVIASWVLDLSLCVGSDSERSRKDRSGLFGNGKCEIRVRSKPFLYHFVAVLIFYIKKSKRFGLGNFVHSRAWRDMID